MNINVKPSLMLGALACVLGMLSGCSTVYEGRYAFNEGWRKAQIEEVGTAQGLFGIAASDCRNAITSDQFAARLFARLSYADFGHLRRRIVLLPSEPRFRAGDAVYFKLRSCTGDVAFQATSQR